MWQLFLIFSIYLIQLLLRPALSKISIKRQYHVAKKVFISYDLQKTIYNWAIDLPDTNLVKRNRYENCLELYLDKSLPLNKMSFCLPKPVSCYGCNQPYKKCHPIYLFSCHKCGCTFQNLRHFSRNLTGKKCLVVGARTKLGHQILVKLLDAGATVIGTSRFPEKARDNYRQYPNWDKWQHHLIFYPFPFDLDTPNLVDNISELTTYILQTAGHLDILINCAAQTIRCREKISQNTCVSTETNRYGDLRFVAAENVNSWNMKLPDLRQDEMEEVLRINAVAPTLIIQQCLPLLQKSRNNPYIINVHAREGLFCVEKSQKHIHTNMAKAGLAMLTKCIKSAKYHTFDGKPFWIHGIDPGWISIDEYYEHDRPFIVPPLDEVDGAARILYPVMANLSGSFAKTRRHFHHFSY